MKTTAGVEILRGGVGFLKVVPGLNHGDKSPLVVVYKYIPMAVMNSWQQVWSRFTHAAIVHDRNIGLLALLHMQFIG